jgi:hypothetical protein
MIEKRAKRSPGFEAKVDAKLDDEIGDFAAREQLGRSTRHSARWHTLWGRSW